MQLEVASDEAADECLQEIGVESGGDGGRVASGIGCVAPKYGKGLPAKSTNTTLPRFVHLKSGPPHSSWIPIVSKLVSGTSDTLKFSDTGVRPVESP